MQLQQALATFCRHYPGKSDTIELVGRSHFAGEYAENLNWGIEAATRGANRVAERIDGE